MENINQINQWELNGDCINCRRRNYCSRDCTAKRKKDQEILNRIVGNTVVNAQMNNYFNRLDGKYY